jgi:hypothetical protein
MLMPHNDVVTQPAAATKDFMMSHNPANHTHHPGPGPRRGWHAGRVLSVLAILATVVGMSAAPAMADGCPNEALRAQNDSTSLPDCRAYELISSPFKEGFAPYLYGYSDGGDFSYTSVGNFANNGLGSSSANQYVATRTATGWTTTAPAPSGPAYMNDASKASAMSVDLQSSIWQMRLPEQPSNIDDLYLRDPDGNFTRIGSGPNPATLPPRPPGTQPITDVTDAKVVGASADLSHVIFTVQPSNGYPGDTATGLSSSLYEYVGTGNDRPRLVGVDNSDHQLGHGDTCGDGISTDGRVVFFDPGCLSASGSSRVWARINGVTSIEASASECSRSPGDPGGLCNAAAPASFAGAASDGSRVFFTTSQQLVNGDTDTTDDLYACDIPVGTPTPVGAVNPCAALRQVSGPAPGAAVESVAAVSKDGSKVYFVAQGVLATNKGANDLTASAGAHNLYLWQQDATHPTGTTTFVATLDTNDTVTPNAPYISADGRYLAMTTSTQLVTNGPTADTDTATDVYRYDAQTATIQRLSTDTSNTGGNQPGLDATLSARGEGPGSTPVTADGDTVVFITNEALSPEDVNGDTDVYAWHQGQTSLISSGRPSLTSTQVPFGAITPSGTDIFFTSTEQLTPADGDTNPDIYDARINGGFDNTTPQKCSGDDCQGVTSSAPNPDTPHSDSPGPDNPTLTTPAFSLKTISAAQRKRLAQTGRLTLTITANTPGVINATATTTITGRSRAVGSAKKTMTKAATTTLTLNLAKQARQHLSTTGHLTVKIVVDHSKVATTHTTTLNLTHTKTKGKQRS